MVDQILHGNEEWSNLPKRTQVFLATHDGGTGERLSLRNRSFITFFYGGKPIEDFHLIATTEDRIQKPAYANFEDIVTTYEVVDGQFYWNTHFVNHEITFTLSTDAITERQLDEFKHWFKPGTTRKLAFAENWNRYVYARVSAPPELSLLPFEQKITQMIAGIAYETSTTVYRGDINITFIIDDPLWKSDIAIFADTDVSPNGETFSVSNKDFLKIMHEDGIPCMDMVKNSMLFANSTFVTVSENTRTVTNAINLSKNSENYLYYCGTAKAKPILTFTLTPTMSPLPQHGGTALITNPKNALAAGEDEDKVNMIQVGEYFFKFTTPSIYTGYNQAVTIASSFKPGESIEDLKAAIRDGVNEYYSRAWAIAAVEGIYAGQQAQQETGVLGDDFLNSFLTRFHHLFDNNNGELMSATFSFNTKTGEALGTFQIRTMNAEVDPSTDWTTSQDYKTISEISTIVENVGDMVKSDYLVIEGESYFNDNGEITTNEAVPFLTNYENGLQNFSIDYKYTYL